MSQISKRMQNVAAWAVLILGTGLSAAVSLYIKSDIEEDAVRGLVLAADQVTARIEERLTAYALMLHGAAGLFAASGDVTRGEWRAYYLALNLSGALDSVQGIGYSELIPAGQLQAHITRIRAEGFPDFRIFPEGVREQYSSIVYLEPFEGRNLRPFGYDMFSEPVRREAMIQARDTGRAALSGKVTLLQETETDVQAGTLMYVPVYRGGSLPMTSEARREALIGWVYTPYRMVEMMSGILRGWQEVELQALRLDIHDGFTPGEQSLLFTNQPGEHALHSPLLSQQRLIDFNGRIWRLEFDRLDAAAGLDYGRAWVSLVTGIVLSGLLSGLMLSILRTQHRAEKLAGQLTLDIRQRELQLRDSEQRWRFAIEGAGDGLWDWDLENDRAYLSPRCKDLLGIDGTLEDPMREWDERLHPDDRDAVLKAHSDYLEGRSAGFAVEQRLRCADGSYKWILDRGTIISRSPEGKPQRMIGTFSDVDARKQAEQALNSAHAESQHFREALDFVSSYIYMKDRNRRYTYANRATLDLFGISAERLIGSSDERFFPAATVEQIQRIDARVLKGERTTEEIEQINPDGRRIVYLEIKAPIYDYNDKRRITGILGISTDISLLKDYQQQLERQARHDPLTQLPNRLMLIDRLGQAMAQAKRREAPLALVYLDLDGFKQVNDEMGHDAGDRLLMTLATRMKAALRSGDTLARIGGDEFVAVLLDMPDKEGLKPVLARLMESIRAPVLIEGRPARVAASMGVSFYPRQDELTPDQLMSEADQAMYRAKQAGKGRVYLYGEHEQDNGGLLAD